MSEIDSIDRDGNVNIFVYPRATARCVLKQKN